MGRHRIEEEDMKKVPLKLSIRKDIAEAAKEAYPNKLSQIIEQFLKEKLDML